MSGLIISDMSFHVTLQIYDLFRVQITNAWKNKIRVLIQLDSSEQSRVQISLQNVLFYMQNFLENFLFQSISK